MQAIFYGSVHLFFYQENHILLLKRKNTGFSDGKWSVVAGRIDGQEEVLHAGIREAKEEAGVDIKPQDLQVIGITHRKSEDQEWVDFYLKVHSWTGALRNCEPEKCEELKWFPLDDLPQDMIPYVRHAVEKSHSELWFDSYGW